MKLFNTATRQLETFSPKDPKNVTIYTCGPTVYSAPHIGNFAAYIYWDLLVRTLEASGFSVKRVINLTDVGHLTSDGDSGEDKLEKGAKREGKTVWEIAEFYIDSFKTDFKKLRLRKPFAWARATDFIEESKTLVEILFKKGLAYETSDGIYFDTSKFPAYPDFARLDLNHQLAGARVDFSSEKRNVSDFAVWKFVRDGEDHAMQWDFLGRPGYPGWHLECSSIIHALLGEPIDIHAGGIDHIPVHHTNEIAQTFGAFEKKLAYFWLHCNFLTIDGQKISKSLGNIITLDDLEVKGFSVFDFKTWLFQGSYHNERNFTFSDLEAARNRRLAWRNAVALSYQTSLPGVENFRATLLSHLENDLCSGSAFAYIDSVKDSLTLADWRFIEELFALDLIVSDVSKDVYEQIRQRDLFKQQKDYSRADEIRNILETQGITLFDSPSQTFWGVKA